MDRRSFLGALSLSPLASNLPLYAASSQMSGEQKSPETLWDFPPDVDYFSRETLQNLLPGSGPAEEIRFQAIAYNFPSWHPSPAQEKFFGQGWTEWETARRAKPEFTGHLQPKCPLWGYFNEAEPEWAEREIETAAAAGIHAFMVDWYWHMGTMWYQEQLEQGFLRARNRSKLHFAIMWANHDWQNLYPAPEHGKPALLYPQTYSEADMERLTDYILEHYLREPNYWRIDDQPVVAIFDPSHFLKFFGVEGTRKVLDGMRNRVSRAGLKGLHIQASQGYKAGETPLTAAGFDSATHYHTFAGGPAGKTSEYSQGVRRSIQVWRDTDSRLDIPYFPDCPVGWDNSPRYGKNAHVFVHRTPDQYELLLIAAKRFAVQKKERPRVIFLSSWNEWTEDHCLLPDSLYGYSYLEAIHRQFVG